MPPMKVTPLTVVVGFPMPAEEKPQFTAPRRVPLVLTSESPEMVVGAPHETTAALLVKYADERASAKTPARRRVEKLAIGVELESLDAEQSTQTFQLNSNG